MNPLFKKLETYVSTFDFSLISEERKALMQPLLDYVNDQLQKVGEVKLNFICTHNSRRSQLCQVWAYAAAYHYGVKGAFFSGGTEVTAFNNTAVETIENVGFKLDREGAENPVYSISCSEGISPIKAYSKLVDDKSSPKEGFGAVMTCSHAEQNCPMVFGAAIRVPLRYEDPKVFDNTPQEIEKYEERSRQIALEMFYLFANARMD